MYIGNGNKIIASISSTKILGITVHMLSQKTHMDQRLPKLSAVCHAIRLIQPLISQHIFKIVYYSYFHSIKNYGNIRHIVLIFLD